MIKKLIILLFIHSALTINIYNLHSQELGGNFNERIDAVDPALIEKSGVQWVRSFVNIMTILNISNNQITGYDQNAIDNLAGIDSLIKASDVPLGDETVKMIFSLKLQFKAALGRVPEPNSTESSHIIEAVRKLLEKNSFGDHIEILVVGNEPMWETPTDSENINRMINFTNTLIDSVDNWKSREQNWKYDIYAGALNRFSDLTGNTIRNAILNLAKTNPNVKGLDIHIHVKYASEIQSDLFALRNNENFSKEVIVTEFSLHRMFQDHKEDNLGVWGIQNGYSSTMKLYEWLNIVIEKAENKDPIDKDLFLSYFESASWYPKTWFMDFWDNFILRDVRAATYGFIREKDLTYRLSPSKPMWIVNAVYNEALFSTDAEGFFETNPLVYPTFSQILDGTLDVREKQSESNKLKLYPNPALNQITVSSLTPGSVYEIFNLQGKTVLKGINLEPVFKLNLSNINQGYYIIRVSDNDNTLHKTFVIN